MKAFVAIACLASLDLVGCSHSTEPLIRSIDDFDRRMETLRLESHIPAISVAIAANQRIAWSKGYGIADLATNQPATDSTVYHFASLTKPFASAVILQLVDEGRITLDDPVANYGVALPSVRIRHLLSHTSRGIPGSTYSYDGNRFSLLDSVIARAAGATFATEVTRRILKPGALNSIATSSANATKLARGYTYATGTQRPTSYPTHFSTAAGLTGSVLDLARFSMTLDRGELIPVALRDLAFTSTLSHAGEAFPYGLGWFSTMYRGERIVWHYGLWTAISSLIIKVPSRGLTFVVLANSDALSAPYPLGAGRLDTSPWARAFLDAFVVGTAALP